MHHFHDNLQLFVKKKVFSPLAVHFGLAIQLDFQNKKTSISLLKLFSTFDKVKREKLNCDIKTLKLDYNENSF